MPNRAETSTWIVETRRPPGRPRGRSSGRCLLPLATAFALAWAVPATPWEAAALLLLGLLGAFAVARADQRAPLRAWRSQWPRVEFGRVARFPTDAGVPALRRACEAATRTAEGLERLPRRRRRATRRELAELVALAAELGVRRDRCRADLALQGMLEPVDLRLAAIPEAIDALRVSVLRAELARPADLTPLERLRRSTVELDAHTDVQLELSALETPILRSPSC
jgi:hypothetical protein